MRSLLVVSILISGVACSNAQSDVKLDKLNLPDGFEIAVYAKVPDARSLRLSDDGVLYVGNRRSGSVYAVIDEDHDFVADTVVRIADGLIMPNGIAYRNGSLFVAESHRVLRFDNIGDRLYDPPSPVVVVDGLPGERLHGWRYIDFGPDDRLYVAVGAPCNVCVRPDPYGTIISMTPDGSDRKIVARGVRNSVGFTWHPTSGVLWFTDNGRDNLGDDVPEDELNRLTEQGAHFGFPYIHAGHVVDPELGLGHDASDYAAPAIRLGAHVAPLGIEFYTGNQFPSQFRKQLIIAEHGSWNRSTKVGYRLSLVTIGEHGEANSYETFIDGWLQGSEAWGRPVDLEMMPDGSLLVSDDHAGVVYRISYSG